MEMNEKSFENTIHGGKRAPILGGRINPGYTLQFMGVVLAFCIFVWLFRFEKEPLQIGPVFFAGPNAFELVLLLKGRARRISINLAFISIAFQIIGTLYFHLFSSMGKKGMSHYPIVISFALFTMFIPIAKFGILLSPFVAITLFATKNYWHPGSMNRFKHNIDGKK